MSSAFVDAISTLIQANPSAGSDLLNVLGHRNGRAATTVMTLLAMLQANPDSAPAICAQIGSVDGVEDLNIMGTVNQLPALAAARASNPTGWTMLVNQLIGQLQQSSNSGFGGRLRHLLPRTTGTV